MVTFVAEAVGQNVAGICLADHTSMSTASLLAGRFENEAKALYNQRKGPQTLVEAEATLKPLAERIIADTVPKVLIVSD